MRSTVHIPRAPTPGLVDLRTLGNLLQNSAIAALVIAALVLLSRRWTGAFVRPLSAWALAIAAMMSLAIALAIVLRPRLFDRQSHRSTSQLFAWPPSRDTVAALALMSVTIAITLPGTPGVGVVGVWLAPALLVGRAIWQVTHDKRGSRQPLTAQAAPTNMAAAVVEPMSISRSRAATDRDVLLDLVRMRLPDGRETIRGSVALRFETGQRSTSAHLAFCPPFGKAPELRALVRGGETAGAKVKIPQLHPYGARLDVRLDATPSQPRDLTIEFEALGPPLDT